MKKTRSVLSVLQCIIGLLGLGAFVILTVAGEPVGRWIPALISALLVLASGVLGLIWRD